MYYRLQIVSFFIHGAVIDSYYVHYSPCKERNILLVLEPSDHATVTTLASTPLTFCYDLKSSSGNLLLQACLFTPMVTLFYFRHIYYLDVIL